MATTKRPTVTANTRPTVTAAGTTPRPTLNEAPPLADRKPLQVVAQASRPAAANALVIHVDVRDAAGAPVTDLDDEDFTVLEMPGGIIDMTGPIIKHWGNSGEPKRNGLYQVIFLAWEPPSRGLIAFHIRVAAGARTGVAMTSIYLAPAN